MIRRELYMDKVKKLIDAPVIKVITGMRRCGKSTLLMMISEELSGRGVEKDRIIYINFESLAHSDISTGKELYDHILSLTDPAAGRTYILLDEIQNVDGWEKAVSSFMVDLDCDIYITGSNAKLLSGELATHIAGRYVSLEVFPLNFREFIIFGDYSDDRDAFRDYLIWGGLPGLFKMPDDGEIKRQYLRDIHNTILFRDVIQRSGIRNTEMLERVVKYIMDNIGNTFSAKNISDYVRSQGRTLSNDTVHSFLRALEDAFLIRRCSRFDLKGKNFLMTQEKYFISDLGVRNSLIGFKDGDIACMLENVVCMELLSRGYRASIGKIGDREVDFVAEKDGDRVYIQVCMDLVNEDTAERKFRSLEAIQDGYPKIVLSLDRLPEYTRNGIRKLDLIGFLKGMEI